MNKTWIIARNVFMKNAKTISFWIMIILPILVFVLSASVGFFTAGSMSQSDSKPNESTKIAVVTTNEQTKETLKSFNQDFQPVGSIDEAKTELKDKKIQAYVDFDQVNNLTIMTDNANNEIIQKLSGIVTQAQSYLTAKQAGISDQQLATLSQPATVQFKDINDAETLAQALSNPEIKKSVYNFVAMGSVIILFFIVIAFANIVVQEIASEKGTRIMEVLVSSAPAKQHFYGKIIGVIMMVAVYVGFYGILAAIGLTYFKDNEIGSFIINEVIATPFFMSVIIFMLVAIIYTIVIAAILGSLSSKAEDGPKMVAPLSYIILICYLAAIYSMSGNNIITQFLSYIPLVSSFLAPAKIGMGFMSMGLGIASLLISVVFLILITYFGGKLYASNVLMYSDQSVWKRLANSIKFIKRENQVK
ncbi:ABC transporter permease [Holzapfeliella sp. JNUCC 72]